MFNINTNNDVIIDYIKRYRESNNIRIRNELIVKCWKSIQNYSKHFYKVYKNFDLIDYDNMLLEAFIKTIDDYDLNRDVKLSTYFYIKSRGIITNKLTKLFKRRKILNTVSIESINEQENFILLKSLCDNKINIENDLMLQCEYEEKIKQCKAIYKDIKGEKAKRIFKAYYLKGLTYSQISKELNIKENSIRAVISRYNKIILS